jgi:hypothetical protein
MVLQIELFQPHTVPSGVTHKCINVLSLSLDSFPGNAILFRVRQQPAIQLALLAGLPPPPRMNLSHQMEKHRLLPRRREGLMESPRADTRKREIITFTHGCLPMQ